MPGKHFCGGLAYFLDLFHKQMGLGREADHVQLGLLAGTPGHG